MSAPTSRKFALLTLGVLVALCVSVFAFAIGQAHTNKVQHQLAATQRQLAEQQTITRRIVMANQRKSDARFCQAFDLIVNAPPQPGPTSNYGRKLAQTFVTLDHKFGCKGVPQ